MDDRVLALCELSNDLLYHKIPKDRLAYYVDGSLKAGFDTAQQYADADLEDMYRQNGISVEYKDDGKGAFGMAYRGQITLSKDGCSLEIFRSSIRELAENSKNGAFPRLPTNRRRTSTWRMSSFIIWSIAAIALFRMRWSLLRQCGFSGSNAVPASTAAAKLRRTLLRKRSCALKYFPTITTIYT